MVLGRRKGGTNGNVQSDTHSVRFWKWAANRQLQGLKDVSLAHILAGDTCEPISLTELEGFMSFKAHCIENLQFIVWYQSYRDRFYELPATEQDLSPGPSKTCFNFGKPSRLKLDEQAAATISPPNVALEPSTTKRLKSHPLPPPITVVKSQPSRAFASPKYNDPRSPGPEDALLSPSTTTPNFSRPLLVHSQVQGRSNSGDGTTASHSNSNDTSHRSGGGDTSGSTRSPRKLHKKSRPSSSGTNRSGRSVSMHSENHNNSDEEGPSQHITFHDNNLIPLSPLRNAHISPRHGQTADPLSPPTPSFYPQPQVTTPTHLPMRTDALNAVATFFKPGAPKELALDACLRDTILKSLVWNTHPDVFLPAYEYIYDLVETQILPLFLLESSANINSPKQIFWYCIGSTDLMISVLIALITITYAPASHAPAKRAYRLFALIPAWFGSMQFYSAARGFCQQVFSRNAKQLRTWELQDITDETEYDDLPGQSVRAKDFWSEIERGEANRVQEIQNSIAVGVAATTGHGTGEVDEPTTARPLLHHLENGPSSTGHDMTQPNLRISTSFPNGQESSGIPHAANQVRTTSPMTPNTPLGMDKSRTPISLTQHSLQRDVIAPFNVGSKSTTRPSTGNSVATQNTASSYGEDQEQKTSLLDHSSQTTSKPKPVPREPLVKFSSRSDVNHDHDHDDDDLDFDMKHRRKPSSSSVLERRRPTRNGYRKPPVFGPEKVVLDPRIIALHKKVWEEILIVGVVWTLIFAAIILPVPPIPM